MIPLAPRILTSLRFSQGLILFGLLSMSLYTVVPSVSWADDVTNYPNRWRVAELAPGQLTPPFELIWNRTPTWFPEMNRGGPSQALVVRVAATAHGVVCFFNRSFYLLDPADGRTLWRLRLGGKIDLSDWKTMGDLVLYSGVDYGKDIKDYLKLVRGAIDLRQRKSLWSVASSENKRFLGGASYDWLMPIGNDRALFTNEYADPYYIGTLDLLDSWSGATIRRVDKGFSYLEDIGWFARNDQVFALLASRTGGLALKEYNLATGQASEPVHIFGSERALQAPPFVVTDNGMVLVVYSSPKETPTLVAFDLHEKRLLWFLSDDRFEYARQVAISDSQRGIALVAIRNDRYALVDFGQGSVKRWGRLPDGWAWEEFIPLLYSHPYAIAGARRETAYGLIALNVETGQVDWTYEFRDRGEVPNIVNFAAAGDAFYLSRLDGRVMAFMMKRNK